MIGYYYALAFASFRRTLGLCAFSIAVATVAWTVVQRHGEPAPAPQAA